MNAFCPNLSNKQVKREFEELTNLFGEDMAYFLWNKNNGYSLDKAPNGADSKLFLSLIDNYDGNREKALKAKAKVYTSEFTKWFGDWTKEDKTNVSKAVDENGEPQVLWHGTENTFDVFQFDEDGSYGRHLVHDPHSFFFTDTQKKAFKYKHAITMPVYLNMRNPGYSSVKDGKFKTLDEYTQYENSLILNDKYDSALIERYDKEGDNNGLKPTKQWVVKNPNQIKSIDNNGQFSQEDNNIYHSKSDNVDLQKEYFEAKQFCEYIQRTYLSFDYYNADKQFKEQLKSKIRNEFNKRYKHYTLNFYYKQEQNKLRMYIKPKSEKDISHWQKIIYGKQDSNSQFSEQDTEAVMKELFRAVRGSSLHERLIVELISKCLKGKHISFEFTNSLPSDIAATYDSFRHTILINDNAAFRNDNDYSNVVTQTILHELLHAITVDTINSNDELKTKLTKLLDTVKKSLGDEAKDYGLNDIYEFLAELSNIKFVEKLQQIKVEREGLTLFQKVRNFFNEVIRKIAILAGSHKNTAYHEAMDLLLQSAFPKDFGLKLTYHEESPTTYNSVSNNTQNQEDIKARIQKQFSILYRAYKKLPNKSLKREQIQNSIFETISDLQMKDQQESITKALDMAIQSIGSIENTSGDAQQNTVLGYLQYESTLDKPFDDISPDDLVLMYQNSIAFYKNMILNELPTAADPNLTVYNREKIKEVTAAINSAYELWKKASVIVTDKIVENIVDENVITSSDEQKENMKEVLKDYLHRNAFYEDQNLWYTFASNNAQSQSPLIKAAFNLIEYAESKTLEESFDVKTRLLRAYQYANGVKNKLTRNWQKQFMEFDKNGVPTGYFIRPINYGQYQLDVNEEIQRLNDEFQQKYGFHYILDDVTGNLINSVTGELADDEEWIDGKMPTIVKYQLAIQKFKCDHAETRFTYEYYRERLSEPYRGTLDPNDVETQKLSRCHGLSPKALSKYNLIQSNINYYLNKCKDPETGFSYPERLQNPEDQYKLDMWQHRLEQLFNAYNEDGTIKTGEDKQIAFELKAWQKWIGEQLQTSIDYDAYKQERDRIEQECKQTGDNTPLNLFLKYNSYVGINPNLINLVFEKVEYPEAEDYDVTYARLVRGMLKASVKDVGLEPDLKRMMNNIHFWLDCKNTDQIIEDGGKHNTKTHKFHEFFEFQPILYKDEYGYYLDEDLNQTTEEDKAITFFNFIIKRYVNQALTEGYIPGLNDENNVPIDFSHMSEDEIKNYISDIFTYTTTREDYLTGVMYEEQMPLTIFNYMAPLNEIYIDPRTGKAEYTIIEIPKGRFSNKTNSEYINEYYDNTKNESEQPKVEYYDNSENYRKVVNDEYMHYLYNTMINVMKESQQNIQFDNQQFNYQLPKLQASDVVSILRSSRGGIKHFAETIAEQYTKINSNDFDQRSTDDYNVGPDQMVNQNIPLKFIGKLKDREKYTYDVVSSVMMYANMAFNYKNKKDILTKLQALRYAQDPENREETVNKNDNQLNQYDTMMDSHVYGNKYNSTAARKIANTIKRLSSVQMLGFNFLSMGAGFMDSARNILKDGIIGRYFTLRDLSSSILKVLPRLPQMIYNIGNPLANNKITALMQLFGIAKDFTAVVKDTGTNRVVKLLNQALMGGYSLLDYFSNAVLTVSFMNNYRFYDKGLIPTGFYTKYEMQQLFIKNGYSKFKANLAHACCSTTLFDAYDYIKGNVWVNQKYEPYVDARIKKNVRGITLLRGALINGVNPDNDNPKFKNTMWGQFIGSMRSWMLQRLQELTAGRDDTSVREFDTTYEEKVINGKIQRTTVRKIKPRTKKQQENRMSWNYSIGMPQPELLKALYRSGTVLVKCIGDLLSFGKSKLSRKLSNTELFALKQVCVEIAMIASMIYSYSSINSWCSDVRPVNLQKESVYSPDEFINSKLYKEWVRNSYIRTVNSAIEQWDVGTVGEIVNSATVLSSGIKSWWSIPSVIMTQDPSNLEPYGDKIIKQGKYRGYTNLEAAFYKTIGFVNNLQSSFTYNGVSSNTSFYSRNYAWWMNATGNQYKPKKIERQKESDINDLGPGIESGSGDLGPGFDNGPGF